MTRTHTDDQAGFRLHQFEVLNWGTFHKHIWTMAPEGHNCLITGDIGSGKSTLIDGLTTLLVPPQKIVYNKAAGAEVKERSLRSYVRGYFKSEKDADTLSAKSVALRDAGSYSVLLARFVNVGYDQVLILAQVFWSRDHHNPPERFFVVATDAFSIETDFTQFGADVADLRKRLKHRKGVTVSDSFTQYAAAFRRKMGLSNPQALELFYQTVSMKSVGNLTDFVRRHMLEEPPVQERIERICRQFDDLNRAHETVLKARQQVQALAPLLEEAKRYGEIEATVILLKQDREALYAYFAARKLVLLTRRIQSRKIEIEGLDHRIEEAGKQITELRTQQRQLERAIGESGGQRLEQLAESIARLTVERRRLAATAEKYQELCAALELPRALNFQAFGDNRHQAEKRLRTIAGQRDAIENDKIEEGVRQKELETQIITLQAELESLKKRRTNIPRMNLQIRSRLCEAVGLTESNLPFAGELLRVRPDQTHWEGAIERLLHAFGLSLLVPNEHYAKVAAHVDVTHLKGRLVYFKTTDAPPDEVHEASDPEALYTKIEIKPDTPFFDWLETETRRRFSHVCTTSTDEFRRRPTAITQSGQIKTGGVRHEKDDRHLLTDRSRYILGWQNREKIRVLSEELAKLTEGFEKGMERLNRLDRQRKEIESLLDRVQRLLSIETFAEIDWQPIAIQIQRHREEQQRIEKSSDRLRVLRDSLEKTNERILREEEQLGLVREKKGKAVEGLSQDQRLAKESLTLLRQLPEAERKAAFPRLKEKQPEAIGPKMVTIENCDANQSRMRGWLQDRIESASDKSQRSANQIVRRMQEYKGRYPLETQEVDASLAAIAAFDQMLAQLQHEDLPRHEKKFKTMLNEGTIQSIALFQAKLDSELSDIRDKIGVINQSLSAIDYDEGSYITMVADPSRDVEIRQFREELRACLGDTLSAGHDQAYTEHKFLQVKAIIDRFNGREGQTDLDKRWTRKVTDVRNWLLFSVSERWREDDKEREFYSDTSGKSGGQKEKLAYTILAAALAYQFGLKWGETHSKALRFVMIDEAFGRGSDESTRYALALFGRLNIQLLIVTPLQKIHIIEDYVKSVHYIHNPDGRTSMIRNLTIEQYRKERDAFMEAKA